jgi:hypothetical protein
MMGSKEEDVPTEPLEKPLFVEDMNESELASAVSKLVVSYTCCPNLIFFRYHCTAKCRDEVGSISVDPEVEGQYSCETLVPTYLFMYCHNSEECNLE